MSNSTGPQRGRPRRAIEFYTKLLKTRPTKIRDGYANRDRRSPLKLVLFTGMGDPAR